jgi:hypothetical protein
VSAPSEIDVAWSVQSGDWPGELPADVAALLAPPVVVSAEDPEDRHNFPEVVASGAR